MQERNEKISTGRKNQGSEWNQERGARVTGGVGAGGAPECPVLLSGWHGVTGSVCLWAGKASIPTAATHSWNATGASFRRFSCCCLQLFMGAPGPCSDSQVQRMLETSTVFLQTITISSLFVHSSFMNLSHFFFFFVCMFVSMYYHFAYNSCLSYFLPVSAKPPVPRLSLMSRLLSIFLLAQTSDPILQTW